MSTVFFITDGSGVGGDNAELARSFKSVLSLAHALNLPRVGRELRAKRALRGRKNSEFHAPVGESGSLARLPRHLCLNIVVTEAERQTIRVSDDSTDHN